MEACFCLTAILNVPAGKFAAFVTHLEMTNGHRLLPILRAHGRCAG
jgi:hypothetical protein